MLNEKQGIRYIFDSKQTNRVSIDELNYVKDRANWLNHFHAIKNKEMCMSFHNGAYIHRVAVYNPDLYYEPKFNKMHYELIVEFSADSLGDERVWMAFFIGARNSSIVPGESNPNLITNDLFASFSDKKSVYLFHGIKGDWPYGSCKVAVEEGFKEKRKISVVDSGDYIVFSTLDDGVKKTIFVVDLSTNVLRVKDNLDRVIYEKENNLWGVKGGYFKLFNHFASTIISSVNIYMHNMESGTSKCIFKDDFKYFEYSENYKIVQFQSNDVKFFINRTVVDVNKHQLLLISPYETHADLSLFNIKSLVEFDRGYISKYFSDEVGEDLLKPFQSKLIQMPEHELIKLQNLFNNLKSTPPNRQFLKLGEMLCLIKDRGVAEKDTILHISEVSHIIEFIDNNFETIENLDTIAKRFYISTSHLCRLFKKATGKTIVEYLNEVRIAQACKILAETDDSITDVFLRCGFNYSSYFAKVFKSITGQTPSSYRRSFRNT